MASTHRMTLLAMLLAGMGAAGSALAGLGPIHVLSSEGQPFEAEIPVVDEDPQGMCWWAWLIATNIPWFLPIASRPRY
jgi:hypothetical protein